MKKRVLALFLGATMLFACGLSACDKKPDGETPGNSAGENTLPGNDNQNGSENTNPDENNGGTEEERKPETAGNELITDAKSIEYAFTKLYENGEMEDAGTGFSSVSDITGARFFVNGEYKTLFTSRKSSQDIKVEFYNENSVRFANISAGFAFSLPTTEITVDYEIAKYHTQISFDDCILTSSMNTQNPYTANANPWYDYGGEWLICHLNNDAYMENQNITRLNGTAAYEFTKTHAYGDLEFRPGFDIYRYDFFIEDSEEIERPYYNIAIIREVDNVRDFALLVLKSKTDKSEMMDNIVKSYKVFRSKGTLKNYFDAGDPKVDPNWNEVTKNYYNQLISSDKVHWGVFSYSMPGSENSLHKGTEGFDSSLNNAQLMERGIEKVWEHKFDIYPTYTHIGWGANSFHYFPLEMATTLAGGNGTNGKPVLQFTYQFTLNNNIVADEVTPMWDILRGKYDDYFHRLARDVKAYAQPVLFRLNNEMNTDWTSYSGMMTLLDPDVFNMTWIRLYNIFIEEGVDNCIWIWNPIATSCPYSNWGEDLCFFPGLEYVNLLGGTNYEMNNYAAGSAMSQIKSFKSCYSSLYEKNKVAFSKWKMILSEFACGSGGDYSGLMGRNRDAQAKWVEEMFNDFSKDKMDEWAQSIKGAIWFNCNDEMGGRVTNRLRFYDPFNSKYDDLAGTLQAFKEGFAKLHAAGR